MCFRRRDSIGIACVKLHSTKASSCSFLAFQPYFSTKELVCGEAVGEASASNVQATLAIDKLVWSVVTGLTDPALAVQASPAGINGDRTRSGGARGKSK